MKQIIFEMAEYFKALGDPTRLKILKHLISDDNLCVGAIARRIGISQPAVSQHLKILKNIDLVHSNRMGFHVHYSVNEEKFKYYREKSLELLSSIKEKCNCNECEDQLKE